MRTCLSCGVAEACRDPSLNLNQWLVHDHKFLFVGHEGQLFSFKLSPESLLRINVAMHKN